MLIPPWRIFVIYSIAKKCAIFNIFGINNKLSDELVANLRQKKHPRQPFWPPRASLLQVFVRCDDTAFEVYFDAVFIYDDLFHQLLHNHAVIRVHDIAALNVFCEGVQP